MQTPKALRSLLDLTTHEGARDPALPSRDPAREGGGGPAAECAQGQGGRKGTGGSKFPANAPLSHWTSLKTHRFKDNSALQEGDQRNRKCGVPFWAQAGCDCTELSPMQPYAGFSFSEHLLPPRARSESIEPRLSFFLLSSAPQPTATKLAEISKQPQGKTRCPLCEVHST